jgi:hypothetical protein
VYRRRGGPAGRGSAGRPVVRSPAHRGPPGAGATGVGRAAGNTAAASGARSWSELSAAWVRPARSAGEGHPFRLVCVHPF